MDHRCRHTAGACRVSAGVALGLHRFASRWSPARRALTPASIAIALPMLLAFAGFFSGAEIS